MNGIQSLPPGPLRPEELDRFEESERIEEARAVDTCDCCDAVHGFEVMTPEGVVRFRFTGWEWTVTER